MRRWPQQKRVILGSVLTCVESFSNRVYKLLCLSFSRDNNNNYKMAGDEESKHPFSRWASKWPPEKRNGTWPASMSALCPSFSHPLLSRSRSSVQWQTFSVSSLKSGRLFKWRPCSHTHSHTTFSLHHTTYCCCAHVYACISFIQYECRCQKFKYFLSVPDCEEAPSDFKGWMTHT